MDEKKVNADEIEALLAGDIRKLAEEMAAAMNNAKACQRRCENGVNRAV